MSNIKEAIHQLNIIDTLDEAKGDWDNFEKYLKNSALDFKKYIEIFKNNKQRLRGAERDLYYWMQRSPDEFINKMIELNNTNSSSAEKRAAKNVGSQKIWENSDFTILRILTYGASKLYGSNTKWCISGNFNNDENRGEYYFNEYLKNDYSAFYFVLSKKSIDKWCICMKKNKPDEIKEIWNNLNEVVDNIPGLPDIDIINYKKDREEYFDLYED